MNFLKHIVLIFTTLFINHQVCWTMEEDDYKRYSNSEPNTQIPLISNVNGSSKQYLVLTHLDLSFSPNLTYISGGTLFSSALSFPNLKVFAVNQCPRLYQINIQANNLSELEAQENPVLVTLKIQSQALKTLNISNSQALTEQTLEQLEVSCPKLENTICDGCDKISLFRQHWPRSIQQNIRTAALQKIKEAYEKKLTELNLYDANINSIGAKILAQNTTLTDLNLHCNNIGDEGAKALAKNRILLSLNLRENNISNKGAEALAQSKTLLSLNLWKNNIGNEGAKALAQSISLTSLDLENNKIGEEGAKLFSQNETLISLDLRGNNNISNETMLLIEKMLMINKTRKAEVINLYGHIQV